VRTTAGVFSYTNLFDTTGLALTYEITTKQLRVNYSAVIGVGFGERLPFDFHWAYGRLWQPVHRITLLSRYHPENTPGWGDSLLLEVPVTNSGRLPDAVALLFRNVSKRRQIKAAFSLVAEAGLSSVEALGACKPEVMFTKITRAYPLPMLGARQIVAKRKAGLLKHNAYTLGRWGSHGYFNLQHLVDDIDATLDIFQNRTSDPDHPYFTGSFYYRV